MEIPKRTVLITGCSDGGMGAALAKEFHQAGLHVYATARDTAKMASLSSLAIQTLPLDIQSDSSIEDCVKQIPHLDILLNNAGAMYTMPIADISVPEAKTIFDINVWGNIILTQAFLPLLLKSKQPIIVNHTSTGVGVSIPFQAVYNASKAAMSRFSDTMRLELEGFGIKVIELRTGGVKTNVVNNLRENQTRLPQGSIYTPAKEQMEKSLRGEYFDGRGISPEQWAKEVVSDLLKKNPAPLIWRGESASLAWFAGFFPPRWFDGMFKKMTGLDKVEQVVQRQ